MSNIADAADVAVKSTQEALRDFWDDKPPEKLAGLPIDHKPAAQMVSNVPEVDKVVGAGLYVHAVVPIKDLAAAVKDLPAHQQTLDGMRFELRGRVVESHAEQGQVFVDSIEATFVSIHWPDVGTSHGLKFGRRILPSDRIEKVAQQTDRPLNEFEKATKPCPPYPDETRDGDATT